MSVDREAFSSAMMGCEYLAKTDLTSDERDGADWITTMKAQYALYAKAVNDLRGQRLSQAEHAKAKRFIQRTLKPLKFPGTEQHKTPVFRDVPVLDAEYQELSHYEATLGDGSKLLIDEEGFMFGYVPNTQSIQ